MWDDFEFAKGRLNGTIVRKGNIPIIIDQMSQNKIYYRTLITHSEGIINFTPNCVNIKPVDLGYINTEEGCNYLVRIPRRRWKQGLDSQGVRAMYESNLMEISLGGLHPELARTIRGKFPSLNEAMDKANRAGVPVAWCREFAVKRRGDDTFFLLFKGSNIGYISLRENYAVNLKTRKQYLNEYVRGALASCGI